MVKKFLNINKDLIINFLWIIILRKNLTKNYILKHRFYFNLLPTYY